MVLGEEKGILIDSFLSSEFITLNDRVNNFKKKIPGTDPLDTMREYQLGIGSAEMVFSLLEMWAM